MTKNQLLKTPLCKLDLTMEDSLVSDCIAQLKRELTSSGVHIDLIFWISDEWFCPDGTTGVAFPFYLLDQSLLDLEKEFIGHAEGETREYCMKLLRHEVAHAIDNAYSLRTCLERKTLFGDCSTPYPSEYTRRPFSKSFVKNLDHNYAQAHPEEDWAETFAVWLDPKSNWKRIYKDWPAIKKLNYVNKKMKELKKENCIICHETLDEISTLPITLRGYLNKRSKLLNKYKSPLFGRNLNRIFSVGSKRKATQFLQTREREICQKVAKSTNQYHYIVRDVFKELKLECKSKGLTLKKSSRETQRDLERLVTAKTFAYIKQGKHKVIM